MSGDNNNKVVVLNLDTKEFVDYLREHPSVQKSMDSVMSSSFFLFRPQEAVPIVDTSILSIPGMITITTTLS